MVGKFNILGKSPQINTSTGNMNFTTTKKIDGRRWGVVLPRPFSTVCRPIRARSDWFRPQGGRRRWYPRSDRGHGPVGRGDAGHEGGYCPAEDMRRQHACGACRQERSHVQTTERRDFSDRPAGLFIYWIDEQDCRSDQKVGTVVDLRKYT